MKADFDLEKDLAWLKELHEDLLKLQEKSNAGKDAHPYYLKPAPDLDTETIVD
jgi:hypothetical protein